MALMRVYCGLAAADPAGTDDSAGRWLTVAVVDDAGRLLDVCDVVNDPTGFAQLGALLTERSGGTNTVAIAADSDEHAVTMLIAAAGGPLAIVDEELLADYADRFADDESPEEISAEVAERNAVGLARALQAGALVAEGQAASRELVALKPVLAAHASVAASRHSTAVALREVLRELYPAALRAYPDPAEPIPLAILDALPEPGLLGAAAANRSRDASVSAELAATGLADAATIAEAITSLRVAIAETPRRTGIGKGYTTAIAETIRQAVAAVRACDAAVIALVALLIEKMPQGRPHPPLRAVPPATQPVAAQPPAAQPVATQPVAAQPAAVSQPYRQPAARPAAAPMTQPVAASHANGSPALGEPSRISRRRPGTQPIQPVSPAPARTPVSRPSRATRPGVSAPAPAAANAASTPQQQPVAPAYAPPLGYPAPQAPSRPDRRPADYGQDGYDQDGYDEPGHQPQDYPSPGFRAPVEPVYPDHPGAEPAAAQQQSFQLSTPVAAYAQPSAWDQPSGYNASLPTAGRPTGPHRPAESPAYRPEPHALAPNLPDADSYNRAYPLSPETSAPGSRDAWPLNPPDLNEPARVESSIPQQRDGRVPPPWMTDLEEPEAPSLRLVESDPAPAPGSHLRLITNTDTRTTSSRPVNGHGGEPASSDGEPDNDLLIFAQMASAWFTGPTDDEMSWSEPAADEGWSAALRASDPTFAEETPMGLPRRVPQANLVPGSPLPPVPDHALRIVRDPAAIAAHTTGYFRGSRRGEEVRGYAVGGRPGRESAGGWDFSRDSWENDRDTAFRSAARR